MRRVVLALVSAGLVACYPIVSEQQSGPEQFEFEIVPGPVEIDRQMLTDMGEPGSELGDVEAVGAVDTPIGRMSIVDYTLLTPTGVRHFCQARFAESSASATCSEGGPPHPEVEEGQVLIPGFGSDGSWVNLEIFTGEGVDSIRAVADDGTVYRSNVVENLAVVIYPEERGPVTVTPLDSDGSPTGDAIRSEMP